MHKKILKKITIGVFCLTSIIINAQKKELNHEHTKHRECNLSKHYEALKNNPEYADSFYKRKAKFKKILSEIQLEKSLGIHKKSSTLLIPVAVHFETGSESNRACLEAYAQTQIDVINADYTATNSNINLWEDAAQYYPGLQPGSIDVKFCIATKNHPAGGDPEVKEGSPLVTIGSNGSNFNNSPEEDPVYAGYMNFVIKEIDSNVLGYSPLIGSIANGSAVVMNTFCFGTGDGCGNIVPKEPFNLGRTVTHELGHFFSLEHPFKGGCSGNNDNLDDTPAIAAPSTGSPPNGSLPGCVPGEYSLSMNYMDYTDDNFMFMFTPDQTSMMEAYLKTVKNDFKTNVIETDSTADETAETLKIYPNPTKNKLNISMKTSSNIEISIFDTSGRRVFLKNYINNKSLFNTAINLKDLPVATYIFTIKSADKIINKKIVRK